VLAQACLSVAKRARGNCHRVLRGALHKRRHRCGTTWRYVMAVGKTPVVNDMRREDVAVSVWAGRAAFALRAWRIASRLKKYRALHCSLRISGQTSGAHLFARSSRLARGNAISMHIKNQRRSGIFCHLAFVKASSSSSMCATVNSVGRRRRFSTRLPAASARRDLRSRAARRRSFSMRW